MDFIAGTFAEPERPEGTLEDRSPADSTVLLGRGVVAGGGITSTLDVNEYVLKSEIVTAP